MTSNDGIIDVVTKNNRVNKMKKLLTIHLELTIQCLTLTNYYVVKSTFR